MLSLKVYSEEPWNDQHMNGPKALSRAVFLKLWVATQNWVAGLSLMGCRVARNNY